MPCECGEAALPLAMISAELPIISTWIGAESLGDSAARFPSVECNSLAAVKRIVAGSDALTAVTLSCISSELENGQFELLGDEPWLTVRYGIVGLKGHPMSSAATRLREFVIDAERAVSLAELQLIARWKPARGRKKPARVASRRA
jgi:DNA-binding transcriptional LysR family regulator